MVYLNYDSLDHPFQQGGEDHDEGREDLYDDHLSLVGNHLTIQIIHHFYDNFHDHLL